MSLQLLNDFILDIKCNSIQTTIPIGGGIADNSILNIKLVDKTIENTKIKDGTINSSLLAPDITISGDLDVDGNLNVSTGSISGNTVNATTELNTNRINTTNLTLVNDGAYTIYGTEILVNGSVNISTDAISTNSIILLTRTSDPRATHAGFLAVLNIVSNVGFDVVSSKNTDVGTFNWIIINPA